MDILEKEWPMAKSTGPASITMNGASIDEVLAILQNQMGILRSVVSQQATYISEMKQREEATTAANEKYVERIAVLEDQLKNDVIANIQGALENHGDKIKDLQERPIIDPDQSERLEAVEKKFASFYGDDTNILGRVQHLENHTKKDREALTNSRDDIRKLNKGMEDIRKDLNNLKSKEVADHAKAIEKLKGKLVDLVDVPQEVRTYVASLDIPHREDINEVRDMIHSLVDDWGAKVDGLQKNHADDMQAVSDRFDGLKVNVDQSRGAVRQAPNGDVEVFQAELGELVSRVSSLESRMARHDLSTDRIGKVEEQMQHTKFRVRELEGQSTDLQSAMEAASRETTKTKGDIHLVKSHLDKLEYRINMIDPLESDGASPSRPLRETVDGNTLRELQASVRQLQKSASQVGPGMQTQEIPVAAIERVATRVIRNFQDSLNTTTTLPASANSPLVIPPTPQNMDDIETLKDIAKELERRMYVMVEECHNGLESLHKDTQRRLHGMSSYLLEASPPCECEVNLDPRHTSALGDPLNLLAYRKSKRQCPACSEKEIHTDIPDDVGARDGKKLDALSMLAYRRCKRRCPACVEKERALGLPDIGGATLDLSIGNRLDDLEAKVNRHDKQLVAISDDNAQIRRGQEDVGSDITELKHTVYVDHKNQLAHLENDKLDRDDIHNMIQNAVRAEHLPTQSDIDVLKNMCSLVASEGRDNLDGLRSRTEKKIKAIMNHLSQHDEDVVDVKTNCQNAHNHIQAHDERLMIMETRQSPPDSNGDNTAGMKGKHLQMEQSITTIMNKMHQLEDEKKKQKGIVDGIQSELTQLQHVVTSEHTPALQRLQRKKGSGNGSGESGPSMDEVIKRAINSAGASRAVGSDDLDKVKRFVRELERRLFTLADECRDKFNDSDNNVKKLGKFTMDAISRIVEHLNGLDHHDVYIPSFPETAPHPPYHFMPSSAVEPRDNLPGISSSAPSKSYPPPSQHPQGEPIHMDDPRVFDDYVRSNLDWSKTLPAKSAGKS